MAFNTDEIASLLERINRRRGESPVWIGFQDGDVANLIVAAGDMMSEIARLEEKLGETEGELDELEHLGQLAHEHGHDLIDYLNAPERRPAIGSELWILLDAAESAINNLVE